MNSTTVVEIDDFLQTGRTGRRNAVPDIKDDPNTKVTTADLPLELQKLTCSETSDVAAVNAGASGSNGDTYRQ
ncbi:hypothetical protein B4U80_10357 [Leptotrombidium deliense]|uniref:cAMP-dependent protein kinase inhibitor beta-like protein n=1 Tax=Leptotrombidium deliense TaxID=299467 RepID=A0A443SD01_9ACAR|nr:hypothetical protein B4U80_10357 [Leptotrombidium deliense]